MQVNAFTLPSYIILHILWVITLFGPLYALGTPLWLYPIVAVMDMMLVLFHFLGHSWGAARYGLGSKENFISPMYYHQIFKGFSGLSCKAKISIIRWGLIPVIFLGFCGVIFGYVYQDLSLIMFLKMFGRGESVQILKGDNIKIIIAYWGYIAFYRLIFMLLPFNDSDGQRLHQYSQEIRLLDESTAVERSAELCLLSGRIFMIIILVYLLLLLIGIVPLIGIRAIFIIIIIALAMMYEHPRRLVCHASSEEFIR